MSERRAHPNRASEAQSRRFAAMTDEEREEHRRKSLDPARRRFSHTDRGFTWKERAS